MINNLDHLGVAQPAAGVKAQRDRALLGHGGVHRRLEVGDSDRILGPLQHLTGVVVGVDERDLPDQVPDRERIRVIFDVVDEARHQVLGEAPPAGGVALEDRARQFPVRRREDDAHAGA